MAYDFLSISISMMASESSFSASGKVTEPHYSSLATDTVQALLCGEDLLRSFYCIKRKAKVMDEVKEILLP
ncbi:putative HAT dimerization domain, ribonuclease H-like superfamily [Dioscorea sansibarensis]